jgi:hypothetical protein
MVKLLTMEDVDRIRNDLDMDLEKHVHIGQILIVYHISDR